MAVLHVLLLVSLMAPYALPSFPFETTSAPITLPQGDQVCRVPLPSGGNLYIPGNEKRTTIDTTARTCAAYWCDGNSGEEALLNSRSCGSQCVDPTSENTHSCKCIDCSAGKTSGRTSDNARSWLVI